jgi:hypothetical protein
MTPLIGFRIHKKADAKGSLAQIRPAATTEDAPTGGQSRVADYAYRIAALTAGLILLATVM